jgi:deoxyadenosine/deoxycytidine kinase
LIAKHLETEAFFEPVGENPVLPLYYADPKQYGFLLQIYFLNKRFAMIKKALADDNNVLDRSIYEDALFTQENHREGNISDAEMDVYMTLLNNMMTEIQSMQKGRPDLMVFADADFETILYRIKKRGRDYEQFDDNDELRAYYFKMWSAYQTWYEEYDASPKIKINLQEFDLEEAENQAAVLAIIDNRLAELEAAVKA